MASTCVDSKRNCILSPYRGPYSWLHRHGGDSRHGRIVQCLHFVGLLVYREANLCSPVIGQSVMEGLEALKLTDSSRTPTGTAKAGAIAKADKPESGGAGTDVGDGDGYGKCKFDQEFLSAPPNVLDSVVFWPLVGPH